jgi:hypothetical protein
MVMNNNETTPCSQDFNFFLVAHLSTTLFDPCFLRVTMVELFLPFNALKYLLDTVLGSDFAVFA